MFQEHIKNNHKSKLIHISTDEVYGDVLHGRSKESDAYIPSSPYAATKASSDHLVYSYIRTYKIPAIVTNCSNNYGPRQHPEKLIPKIIFNIISNMPLPIYGKVKIQENGYSLMTIVMHDQNFQKRKNRKFLQYWFNYNLNNISVVKNIIKNEKKN